MKKLFLTLLLLPVALAAQVTFQSITFYEAQEQARKKGKPIFVNVYRGQPEHLATQAREVMEQVLADQELATYLKENFILVGIDMMNPENSYFRPYLNMAMWPCVSFYNENGVQLSVSNWHNIRRDSSLLYTLGDRAIVDAEEKRGNTRRIEFRDISFEEALDLAKKENKMVFVNATTEWCRPCRLMSMRVFTLNRVADFFNQNFICLYIDFEKHPAASDLRTRHEVRAFPTFLFINGDGELVYKSSGFKEAELFIEEGQAALDAFKKITTQISQTIKP